MGCKLMRVCPIALALPFRRGIIPIELCIVAKTEYAAYAKNNNVFERSQTIVV